jgi:hypothetical protein
MESKPSVAIVSTTTAPSAFPTYEDHLPTATEQDAATDGET